MIIRIVDAWEFFTHPSDPLQNIVDINMINNSINLKSPHPDFNNWANEFEIRLHINKQPQPSTSILFAQSTGSYLKAWLAVNLINN